MNEKTGDTLVFIGISDGDGKQIGHRNGFDFSRFLPQWDGIAYYQLFQYTVFDVFVGVSA
jgi:hypothetical protein